MAGSIREIARLTGLSSTAVSQALRGIGRLSPETRARIRAAADELAYSPDPLFSQAFSRARQPRVKRFRETLALILEWETAVGPWYQREMHQAIREQAAFLGYGLESFVVSGRAQDQRRLSKILRARGIHGVIILPRLENVRPRMHLDWEDFSTVVIGRTIWHPRNFNRVESGDYMQLLEALHLLKKVGYRRIGMAVEAIHNTQQNGIYYAAFLHTQIRLPAAQQVPIFAPTSAFEEQAFRRWLETHHPDVLIIHKVNTVSAWLADLGLRVPEDISLFCINVEQRRWSGLRRNYRELGRSAMESVAQMLRNGERGLLGMPRTLLVEGAWQIGETLRLPITRFVSPAGILSSSP